ncbi:MAG: hypothetical protein REI11_19430 [Patulibacter sp.]|nr:hypothetical protein [Patulibacter sp.]
MRSAQIDPHVLHALQIRRTQTPKPGEPGFGRRPAGEFDALQLAQQSLQRRELRQTDQPGA